MNLNKRNDIQGTFTIGWVSFCTATLLNARSLLHEGTLLYGETYCTMLHLYCDIFAKRLFCTGYIFTKIFMHCENFKQSNNFERSFNFARLYYLFLKK